MLLPTSPRMAGWLMALMLGSCGLGPCVPLLRAADDTTAASTAMPEFRPSDTRPRHDDRKLEAVGIRRFESKRLRLYTDIDPKIAATLPPIVDAAYDAWVERFEPLPPNRERSEFQVTGYLMSDKALFRDAGLIPAGLPDFVNGRHRGAEFWMMEQKFDYYRRHLLIHEATHCYMTILGGPLPPVWYMEGMAERFGTHRRDENGMLQFGVMPENQVDYLGLGRITFLRQEAAAGRIMSLDEILALRPQEYIRNDAYAWSWALCAFLDNHPRWKERFRKLGRNLTYRAFEREFHEAFDKDAAELRQEWELFVHSVIEGFDFDRAAVLFRPTRPLAAGQSVTVTVEAERGWQSSGVLLEAGGQYEITAEGSFTVARKPRPWRSEPQGVSIRYVEGRPLGQLLGWIAMPPERAPLGESRSEEKPSDGRAARGLVPVGREKGLAPASSGPLFLRLNDAWSELSDNAGTVVVRIRRVAR